MARGEPGWGWPNAPRLRPPPTAAAQTDTSKPLAGVDGWKVDDVASAGGEESWMFSWLLRHDPWGMM